MRDIVVIDRRYNTQAEKLNKAKKAKNDEFYTQYSDIEKELEHYNKDKFKDKIIYRRRCCVRKRFSSFSY